jgi:hypothetical protein
MEHRVVVLLARKFFFRLDPERMFSLSGLENMEFICQFRNNLKYVASGYRELTRSYSDNLVKYEPSQTLVICLYLVGVGSNPVNNTRR